MAASSFSFLGVFYNCRLLKKSPSAFCRHFMAEFEIDFLGNFLFGAAAIVAAEGCFSLDAPIIDELAKNAGSTFSLFSLSSTDGVSCKRVFFIPTELMLLDSTCLSCLSSFTCDKGRLRAVAVDTFSDLMSPNSARATTAFSLSSVDAPNRAFLCPGDVGTFSLDATSVSRARLLVVEGCAGCVCCCF